MGDKIKPTSKAFMQNLKSISIKIPLSYMISLLLSQSEARCKIQTEYSRMRNTSIHLCTGSVPPHSRMTIYAFRLGKTDFSIPPLRQSNVDGSQIMPSFQLQISILFPSTLSHDQRMREIECVCVCVNFRIYK